MCAHEIFKIHRCVLWNGTITFHLVRKNITLKPNADIDWNNAIYHWYHSEDSRFRAMILFLSNITLDDNEMNDVSVERLSSITISLISQHRQGQSSFYLTRSTTI